MSSADKAVVKLLPQFCWCHPTNYMHLVNLKSDTTSQQNLSGILSNYDSSSVKTLAIVLFRQLFNSSTPSNDTEVLLKRTDGDKLVLHLLLSCLAVFTNEPLGSQSLFKYPAQQACNQPSSVPLAKGTGFAIGNMNERWSVEQAVLHQKCMEQHIKVLLQMLSTYINPGGLKTANNLSKGNDSLSKCRPLPHFVHDLLLQSCLLQTLSSYLSNDSVLDMARRIPLYRTVMQLLQALALDKQLVSLLIPVKSCRATTPVTIVSLLLKMKTVVETYASQLKLSKLEEKVKSDEDLVQLIPDIQSVISLVQTTTGKLINETESAVSCKQDIPVQESLEQRYLKVMKPLQFETYEMITESSDGNGFQFVVSYHFEANLRVSGDHSHPARMKRLAQEMVTLYSSLPLSFSSSVFVCCDAARMDIMKVLIMGPADTPYANGCFELDVYFPPDYPNTPMLINLKTTGGHRIQFNPNLYPDGKVCLSILNTWFGQPEEQWNPQLSSLLQVLVSIQSLIMVPEPFFNEPGYEYIYGTSHGNECSYLYNSHVRCATLRWAMLDQLRNPSPCFKQVIQNHFWMKRQEVKSQIEAWIKDLEDKSAKRRPDMLIELQKTAFKDDYQKLCEELDKLKSLSALED